jgi:hypothetical protein
MHKYLVRHTWGNNENRDEHVSWNAFVMPNHYNHSVKVFAEMAALIRQTFPEATDDQVNCRTVVKSAWCNGFPVAHFGLTRKQDGNFRPFEPTEEQKQGWTVLDERPLPDMQLS